MKNVTDTADKHEWHYEFHIAEWWCSRCGVRRVSGNRYAGGCAPKTKQRALKGEK